MKMRRINRIGVLSLGKILGVLYALFGLIFGLLITMISLFGFAIGSAAAKSGTQMFLFPMLFGIGAVIFLPVFYGLCGFIGGIIMTFLYNFVAGKIGGLELETE